MLSASDYSVQQEVGELWFWAVLPHCLLNTKDTEVVELENDECDFSIPFRNKQKSNHMAI